jgi:acid phosphatase (class A)
MKKILFILAMASIFLCPTSRAEEDVAALSGSNNIFASDRDIAFLTEDEIPTGAKFLPLPPKPGEASFYNDWMRYEWGKTMRDTERGKQAREDAVHTLEYFAKIYAEPLGITISKENTPEIYKLLDRLLATTRLCNQKSRSRLMRVRPFVKFNEPTPVPEDEERLKTNSSYPSGHTTMGWAIALVLSEINPARQDEILKRGFEYGESRVIVGFHFQSDVDAARVITSALVNRLHANNEFVNQMQKAKEEFLAKSAE